MNKRFVASCLVMFAVAALGYWIWSDAAPAPKTGRVVHDLNPATVAVEHAPDCERFSAGEIIEVIDLSRQFFPTGDELDLPTLLESLEPETLPAPRFVPFETLPFPHLAAGRTFPGAAEEASEPPSRFEALRRQVGGFLAETWLEIRERLDSLTSDSTEVEPDRP